MSSRTEIASKLAGKAQAAISALSGEKGIFRRLKEEHAQLAVLMGKVTRTRDPSTRRELFPLIRAELLSHAKGEQAELMIPVPPIKRTRIGRFYRIGFVFTDPLDNSRDMRNT